MKITVENFNSKLKPADVKKLPAALKESYKDVKDMLDLYDDDKDIKKFIDVYISKLNQALLSKKTSSTIKKTNKSAATKKTYNYAGMKVAIRPYSANSTGFIIWDMKSNKRFANEKFKDIEDAEEFIKKNKMTLVKNSTPTTKQVAEITLEVRFIKRYILMDGRKKTRKQLLTFINTLQRSLTKKQITKSSKYAKEIEHIEKELVSIYNDAKVGKTFTFRLDDNDKKVVEKFNRIAHSQQQRTSVRLISRFIGIHGRSAVKEKAESLLKAVKHAFKSKKVTSSDPYYKKAKQVEKNLENYIAAKEERLVVSDAQLRGLQGVTFSGEKIGKPVKSTISNNMNGLSSNSSGIMSSLDVARMQHHPIGFEGKWLQLIGDPVLPFSMMFWSKPGKGKSSLAIELSKYFAHKFNKKVLYASSEEGLASTLQDKFKRFNAFHPNTSIAPNLPNDLSPYDIIFIDSVTNMKMRVDDFIALKKKYPQKTFVLIFQSTSDGSYRGSKEWEHEVVVSIYINEYGYASAIKTRFGGNGTIKVFTGNTDQVYKFTNLQDAEKFVVSRKDEKLRILNGDDGKKWVTNVGKAQELEKQGYELY
ncbi:MAG: AAA family ATPase [Bacteroidota bacterium]